MMSLAIELDEKILEMIEDSIILRGYHGDIKLCTNPTDTLTQ